MDSPTRASDEAYAAACEAGDRVACRLPRSAALSPRNERKNRYTNVLPFDSNRVVLGPRAGAGAPTDAEGGGDYVNASWVRPRLAGDGGVECVLLEGAAPPPAQQAALRRALPADYIACQVRDARSAASQRGAQLGDRQRRGYAAAWRAATAMPDLHCCSIC